MTRRTLSWSVALAAAVRPARGCLLELVERDGVAIRGGRVDRSDGRRRRPPRARRPPSAQPRAPAAPSIEIPSFELPNDDKGLEGLLPDKLCGKTATKLSMSGDRFAGVTDKTFTDTLAKLGKSPKDVAFAVATGAPSSNCKEVAVVFQIKGADAGRFSDVFIQAAKDQSDTTYTTGNVGGKDVYIGTTPGRRHEGVRLFQGGWAASS